MGKVGPIVTKNLVIDTSTRIYRVERHNLGMSRFKLAFHRDV